MTAPDRPVVLVVEDNPHLVMVAEAAVEEAGYLALPVRNADDALAVLRSRDDIRAMLVDIQLPGSMNGVKLAFHVHETWPGVRIVVASGWSALGQDDLPPGALFLAKPYDLARLGPALSDLSLA